MGRAARKQSSPLWPVLFCREMACCVCKGDKIRAQLGALAPIGRSGLGASELGRPEGDKCQRWAAEWRQAAGGPASKQSAIVRAGRVGAGGRRVLSGGQETGATGDVSHRTETLVAASVSVWRACVALVELASSTARQRLSAVDWAALLRTAGDRCRRGAGGARALRCAKCSPKPRAQSPKRKERRARAQRAQTGARHCDAPAQPESSSGAPRVLLRVLHVRRSMFAEECLWHCEGRLCAALKRDCVSH